MNALSLDAGLTVWTIVTFVLLLVLLARFAFKPLRVMLAAREAAIRGALDEAARARAEAEALVEKHQAQLTEAREETRRIVDEGRRLVAEMQREARQQARAEADRVMEQTRAELDRETQRSLGELKSTVAGLSLRIARQVIGDNLDDQRHEAMADELIEQLRKTHARPSPGA